MKRQASGIFGFFCVTLLLLPFLTLFFLIDQVQLPALSDWLTVAWRSFLQAGLSAGVSLLFGWLGTIGLFGLGKHPGKLQICELIYLLPNFIPALFVCLSFLNLVRPFPFGWVGIILVHAAMNSGLIAIFMYRQMVLRAGRRLQLALVEGANWWTYWRWAGWRDNRWPESNSGSVG